MTVEGELSEFFKLFLEALLLLAIPLLIAMLIRFIRATITRVATQASEKQLAILEEIVKATVSAAEQIGLVEHLAGSEKRDLAIQMTQNLLDEYNIHIDIANIAAVIEAEVMRQFNNPSLPGNLPSTRQEIIQEVIAAALTAAEQSGLDQAMGNILDKKFNYALKIANRYFTELNISIDGNLIKNLIMTGLNKKPVSGISADQKQTLISQSVEAAVLAAEQSGLEGLFANEGKVKKSYAMYFARELLKTYEITVDENLLSGLIEARLGALTSVFNRSFDNPRF